MILQLNPCIPVSTPKGTGETIAWFDYSQEHHLMWLVALDNTGEVWLFPNTEIRLIDNYSIGRNIK